MGNNPIVIALREIFGPLLKLSAKLAAPLAYGIAIVVAFLSVILLGAVIPNPLVWLLGFVILTCLVAFVFTDLLERGVIGNPKTMNTDPLHKENTERIKAGQSFQGVENNVLVPSG